MADFDDLLSSSNPFEDPFAKPRSSSPDPWANPYANLQSEQSAFTSEYESGVASTPTDAVEPSTFRSRLSPVGAPNVLFRIQGVQCFCNCRDTRSSCRAHRSDTFLIVAYHTYWHDFTTACTGHSLSNCLYPDHAA
jgi:hypothetical protein